jgi:Na+/proline symporter
MFGGLHWIDWAILVVYFVAMQWIGVHYAGRASKSLDEYFLSGRALPWWIAGTSMVATSFSADTPLLVSGWVRDFGIWKNWAWWCYAISGSLQVFLFARWWRRAGVMTKAELVELRYGGAESRLLRGLLGGVHALLLNTLIMAWVLLAAAKIASALFAVPDWVSLTIASVLAVSYSITAGLWGVVVTDVVQFALAMLGAVILAWVAWGEIGGGTGALAAVADGRFSHEMLRFFPEPGAGGVGAAAFWTSSFTALAVYLGVSWWAVENVDGAGAAVQRIAASKSERDGLLAMLWFQITHYALRPWFWIVVGLASVLILPTIELTAPAAGRVVAVEEDALVLALDSGGETRMALDAPPASADWRAEAVVEPGTEVAAGQRLARTDPELAYVVMLKRYLPIGLLGLVIASLVAAFMSTIDTHVNLAASYFVNDFYQPFLAPGAGFRHHLLVSRIASGLALVVAALIALASDSIRDLFTLFLALLGGVGPVYLLRWVWWRVRASTELAAMLASIAATLFTKFAGPEGPISFHWQLGPLASNGALSDEGRLVLVVGVSILFALATLVLTRAPDPRSLVEFYRRVQPIGAWGPVRALCPDVAPHGDLAPCLAGSLAGIALTYGLMLAPGYFLLARWTPLVLALLVAVAGVVGVAWALRRLAPVTPSGRS